MSHFAKIDDEGIVLEIVVAEQDFIDSGAVGEPSKWIRTSYNTFGGKHLAGGTPFRKNYAGIGYRYDSVLDAFIPPKPLDSWVLNEETCLWETPIPYPTDGEEYTWDESQVNWIKV